MRQSSYSVGASQKDIRALAGDHYVNINIKAAKTDLTASLVNGILEAGTLISADGKVAVTTGGVYQVETATVVGTVTTTGNAKVTVTAFGMLNSPKDISVAVALDDTADVVAGKIKTALSNDTDVSALFTVGGTAATVTLTAKTIKDKDTTLNIAIDNDTCVGLTAAATSTNTTAPSPATTTAYGVLFVDVDFNNSKGTEILPVCIHGFLKESEVKFSAAGVVDGEKVEKEALNMIKFL